jgi:hypothetical protein
MLGQKKIGKSIKKRKSDGAQFRIEISKKVIDHDVAYWHCVKY